MQQVQRLAWHRAAAHLLNRSWIALAIACVFPAHAGAIAQATLVIHVEDVSPKGGILRLGVYDKQGYPHDDAMPIASADVPARSGEIVITLRNIPPGAYAIETFQDLNSNNRMDRNWFGLPLEPFGFSHDVRPGLSRPSFSKVKIELVPGINLQTLHLQNSISLIAKK